MPAGEAGVRWDRRVKKQDELGEATEKAGGELLASEQLLREWWGAVKDRWIELTASSRDILNHIGVDALTEAYNILPYFANLAYRTATNMRGVYDEAIREIKEPQQLGLFDRFFQNVPDIMSNFGHALVDFGLGVFNILSVASPEVLRFSEKLSGWMQGFVDWTQSLEGQASLREWFEESAEWIERVRKLFKALGGIA